MSREVVLCVDDEMSILKSLERCLLMEDYDVIKATSGEEGLQALQDRGGKVDLIIIDQRMPQMTGDEFLQHVKERYGRMTSIMLSGYADFGSLMRAINEGEIYRFVAKPWDNSELLGIVKAAIRSGARRAS